MNIIVCGSRDFSDYDYMQKFLSGFFTRLVNKKDVNYTDIVVFCGKARGADSMGEIFAKKRGVQTRPFPADWDTYGRGAGFKRNSQMVEEANVTIAFFGGKESNGTRDTIKKSRKKGIPTIVLKDRKIHEKYNLENW